MNLLVSNRFVNCLELLLTKDDQDEDKFDYYEVVFEPDDAPPLGLRTWKWCNTGIGWLKGR